MKVGLVIAVALVAISLVLTLVFCGPSSSVERAPEPAQRSSAGERELTKLDASSNDAPARSEAGSSESSHSIDAPTSVVEHRPTVRLFGKILPASGEGELGSPAHIELYDTSGASSTWFSQRDGSYSIDTIYPGRCWLLVGASNEGGVDAMVDLEAAEPEQRLDLRLVAGLRAYVRVLDERGDPLDASGMRAFATREPPSDWIEFFRDIPSLPNGGNFRAIDSGAVDFPRGTIGDLGASCGPTTFVSLLRGERVLATQRVEAGASEVTFTLDSTSPLLRPSTLRLKPVDAVTRQPLATATARFNTNGAFGNFEREGDELVARTLFSGWSEISIEAPSLGRVARRVRIEAGSDMSLGEIALEAPITISGAFVADSEEHLPHWFDFRDQLDERGLSMFGSGGVVGDHGRFEINGLARGVYRLSGTDARDPKRSVAVEIDARAGSVTNVVARLAPMVTLRVRPNDERWRDYLLVLLSESGAPIERRTFGAPSAEEFELARGRYGVELRRGDVLVSHTSVTLDEEDVELALP